MPTDTLTPVPGNPEVVSSAGHTLSSIAAEIASTATQLRALATAQSGSDLQWSGTAAVRAHARSVTLPPKLDKARASYADAGASLSSYANALATAQADSRAAIRAANAAEIELAVADTTRRQAAMFDAAQAAAAVAVGKPAPPPTAPRYDGAIANAHTRIRRAIDANQAAHDKQRTAAKTAAAALHAASRAGIAHKHWWQHALSAVGHWASAAWTDSLRFVAKTATAISALAGLAALVVAVVGIVCPPLEVVAASLEDISLTAAGIAAVADLALAITGKGSWTTVGWDALSFAPAGASKAVRKLAPAVRKLRLFKPSTVAHASTGLRTADEATIALHPTIVGEGTGTRRINFRPHAADPDWGLTKRHINKHLFGQGEYSLSVIDPAGRTNDWVGYIQDLANRPPTKTLEDGIIDIMGKFPKSDGSGTLRLGIRLSPRSDDTFDLVTLLTSQW